MRFVATIFFSLAVVSGIHAQSCVKFPSTVELRGLRLRQGVAQAKNAIPQLKTVRKSGGIIKLELGLSPSHRRPAALRDVQVVQAYLIDNSLYYAGIVYMKSDLWIDAEDFVLAISKKFGLPHPAEWKVDKEGERLLQCGEQIITARFVDGHPMLTMFDIKGMAEMVKREQTAAFASEELKEALKDERRARFKP